MNIDAIIIEILPKDDIDEKYFLLPYLLEKEEYHKIKRIYISQFHNNNLNYIYDEIKSINQYELIYLSKTSGIPGTPIFLEGFTEAVGINKVSEKEENGCNILTPIINSLKNNLEYGKIQFQNDLYEGFIRNKKCEGYGKYTYENGNYYIGEFKEGKKDGNGIEFYKNNTIKYEGYYEKDKCEKYGKYIYPSGNYYKGQFLNGLKHGNGTEYYKNNAVKYSGDYVNDKCEGYGKFIYESGNYYLGQFSNGLKHGKGKFYYKNNTLKYEGDFVNDKCEGIGKYIYENGDYYIGEFFDNKRNGKGTYYYKNGTKYEGYFSNNEFM